MLKKKKQFSSNNNQRFLLRYAGLGAQLLAGIGIAVFIGLKTDRWLGTLPVFSCVLPLLILFAVFYKLFRDTSSKRDSK